MMAYEVRISYWSSDLCSSDLLSSCYRTALKIATQIGAPSVAFPAISTGVYGFPLEQATAIAVATVRDFLARDDGIERVIFCVFGPEAEAASRRGLARCTVPSPFPDKLPVHTVLSTPSSTPAQSPPPAVAAPTAPTAPPRPSTT